MNHSPRTPDDWRRLFRSRSMRVKSSTTKKNLAPSSPLAKENRMPSTRQEFLANLSLDLEHGEKCAHSVEMELRQRLAVREHDLEVAAQIGQTLLDQVAQLQTQLRQVEQQQSPTRSDRYPMEHSPYNGKCSPKRQSTQKNSPKKRQNKVLLLILSLIMDFD